LAADNLVRLPQSTDPRVSRTKFDREVGEFKELEADYRARGWLLLSAAFPTVLVALAAPQLNPPAMVTGVQFDYTNYDSEPPSVRLVNPFTGVPYLAKELPTALNRVESGQELELPGLPAGGRLKMQTVQPLMQFHTPDEVPFLCLPGVREYHEHPAHSGDPWQLHRPTGAGRLVRLLQIIYRYGVQPLSGYNVTLVPQVSLRVGPVEE